MEQSIILIGPVSTGKSTIAKLLSKKLEMPIIYLDGMRWENYKKQGYDFEYAEKLFSEKGFLGRYKYWKPFEAHLVEEILRTKENLIFDFGAGLTVYEDKNLFERVNNALAPFPNVVLILPSSNKKESLEILNKRKTFPYHDIFINNNSNEKIAKITVYTKDKTPDDTCQEILNKLDVQYPHQ